MTLEIGQFMAHGGGGRGFSLCVVGSFPQSRGSEEAGGKQWEDGEETEECWRDIHYMDGDRMVPFALPEVELSLVGYLMRCLSRSICYPTYLFLPYF